MSQPLKPDAADLPDDPTEVPPAGSRPDVAMGAAELVVDSFGEYVHAWSRRVRSGDSGALPVVAGLIVIVIIFQVQQSEFLSVGNIVNLVIQGAVFMLLGMAEMFALLLGEIDLSVGYQAGLGAAVCAVLLTPQFGWPWWGAMLGALAGTTLFGALQGTIVTRLGLPSFVVTLAGLLGGEGLLIQVIGSAKYSTGGTIRITNNIVNDVVNGNISPVAGWIMLAVLVVLFALFTLRRDTRRRASGLAAPPLGLTVLRIALVAAAGVVLLLVCNANRGNLVVLRGVPFVVPILLAVLVGWTFLLNRMRFGRYVYAIGGNPEAARRAGVRLARIRTACFALAGLTAGVAGIVYESRLGSISNNIDGGTYVLYAVAAAVIGGTSLFGGRGKPLHAVLGGIVIAAIYNGLGLLGVGAAVQYMVTALVLLAAVTMDRLTRRNATTR
ncbi:MAG: ABC transporter permease [Actinomycetota bacterium]|nr:ABC transporter permease [Actinomycetota bacterium]